MSRRHRIRKHYEPRLAAHREHFKILDWRSRETQDRRFQVLVDNVDLRGASLLDVGCGLGDLVTFLSDRKIDADYTGVDILEKMIDRAARIHPKRRFVCADVFAANPFKPASFDAVFCSGALNLNLGNNVGFLPTAVGRFLELARRWVVFNLLHARAAQYDELYFHYDPVETLELLRGFDCDVKIVDDYLPNDFTVICTKKSG